MRVRMGWSGETQTNVWQKVNVELEQEDLLRLLVEYQIPDELVTRLPTKLLFQLLQNEAECLLLNKLRTLGYPPDKANARMAVLLGQTNEIVAAVRDQLVPA